MLIDYFIQKPQKNVTRLSREIDFVHDLRRQHQSAFSYRLKRFAVTKVGVASAFTAGAGYQTMQSENISKSGLLTKAMWLSRLL